MNTRIAPGGVDMTNFAALGIPGINFGRHGEARFHTPADNLEGTGPQGLEAALQTSCTLLAAVADNLQIGVDDHIPWEQLQSARSYGSRWGWGIVV
jgi:hypothetical protein